MAHQMDPVTSYTDRLYLFWQAYDLEAGHLKLWHDDPLGDESARRKNGDSSNPLYDSFLNTWAEGKFEDKDLDPNKVPWGQKTYFAALDVPSLWLRKQCLDVLTGNVDSKNGRPELANGKNDGDAKAKTEELAGIFTKELGSLRKIDSVVQNEVTSNPKDVYLQALLRMMQIETECFTKQKYFLETGQVPDVAPSA